MSRATHADASANKMQMDEDVSDRNIVAGGGGCGEGGGSNVKSNVTGRSRPRL